MLRTTLSGLLLLIVSLRFAHGDYYSSNSGLDDLLKLEAHMVENLENYINAEQQRYTNIQKFIGEVQHELDKVKNDSEAYFGNPLNAWKAIKRMTREWRDFYLADLSNRNQNEFANRIATYVNTTSIRKPNVEDLYGAARGIGRLQRTYNLETSNLANGTIMGRKVSDEMSASDCYHIGMGLINSTDFGNGAAWLLEARGRLAHETQQAIEHREFQFPYLQDNMILDSLVPAVLKNGNTKLALWLLKEQIARDPQDAKALENYEIAEKQLRNERIAQESLEEAGGERHKTNQPMTLTQMYEKTCSGELTQTPSQKRKLRCHYAHNGVPFCLIAPFKVEVLNLDPYLAFYHEVIYESEIETIFKAAEDKVERSKVGGAASAGTVSEIRTSKNSWLYYEEHEFLKPIGQRLTDITGLSLESAEALQVANYGIGGHYGPHYDFSEVEGFDYDGKGNRILTALFYINDVEFGGYTAFPFLRLAVPPIRRSLVLWYNLHRSLERDYRTKHAGCPVVKGSKWICNEWYHTRSQEFIRPCGLEPDGYLSEDYKGLGQHKFV